ncbi:MAG: hypothetical protein ACKVZJ_01850 [Phycisphaerales bacterium]
MSKFGSWTRLAAKAAFAVAAALVAAAPLASARPLPLPTTSADFSAGGSQPLAGYAPFRAFSNCQFCHADYFLPPDFTQPDFRAPGRWAGSMHAHSARDPLFLAALAIANQDAASSGELCLRCHAPQAFFEGRVVGNPSGSALTAADFNAGVSCHVCHRTVDPVYNAGIDPVEDQLIIAALTNPPVGTGNAQIIVDPQDRRRGPFDLDADWASTPNMGWPGFHAFLQSPYHRNAQLCGQCHDVSNPVFSKQPNGDYTINNTGQAHPTGNKHEMFPEQRTYSEWLNTSYANGGVNTNGRFGGNLAVVSTCQDCHMQDQTGFGCNPDFQGPERTDLPYHGFSGSNRWMLDMIEHLYAADLTVYQLEALQRAKTDAEMMLQNASDMTVTQVGAELRVRVTNECGHKLFTGYPEGRRAWINVRFLDVNNALIAERGNYDSATATLTTSNTKVYEVKHGLDAYMAGQTGLPAGPSFHLTLNNKVISDNRIPPRGFTNAAFASVDAEPKGYTYADGQHWDDTCFLIPDGTKSVQVRFFHQIASREYMEFLLNTNTTNGAGVTAYNAWIATGMSPPSLLDTSTNTIANFLLGDLNADGAVNTLDLTAFLGNFGAAGRCPSQGDLNGDGAVNTLDLTLFLSRFGQSI